MDVYCGETTMFKRTKNMLSLPSHCGTTFDGKKKLRGITIENVTSHFIARNDVRKTYGCIFYMRKIYN